MYIKRSIVINKSLNIFELHVYKIKNIICKRIRSIKKKFFSHFLLLKFPVLLYSLRLKKLTSFFFPLQSFFRSLANHRKVKTFHSSYNINFFSRYRQSLIYLLSFAETLRRSVISNLSKTCLYVRFYKFLKIARRSSTTYFKIYECLSCILNFKTCPRFRNKYLNFYIQYLLQLHMYGFEKVFLRKIKENFLRKYTLLDLL